MLMLRRYEKLDKVWSAAPPSMAGVPWVTQNRSCSCPCSSPPTQDFYSTKRDRYDISKIADIYDCIVYDVLHNQRSLQLSHLRSLYLATKPLADFVVRGI